MFDECGLELQDCHSVSQSGETSTKRQMLRPAVIPSKQSWCDLRICGGMEWVRLTKWLSDVRE